MSNLTTQGLSVQHKYQFVVHQVFNLDIGLCTTPPHHELQVSNS